ncbi:MAG: hypothetical protein L0213_08825, partial [Candidatus Dadabacteria bacterium]|nr:hypothetical protein [Candidatus Dadabacteria bacterium]
VGCPQCKTTFAVRRNDIGTDSGPAGGTPRDEKVDARAFVTRDRPDKRADRARADRLVARITVFTLLFAIVFVVGFFIGRYTHDYSFTNPFSEKGITPVERETPRSVIGDTTESTEALPASAPANTTDTGDAPVSEPLMLEESYTSDIFLDVTEIDGELNEVTEVTGLQRELELKAYAQDLVGTMLVGYFTVRDVGTLGSMFSRTLPLSLYNYYIEAEADSSDEIRSVIYVGLKEADDLSSSLDRGSRVFIQGFIYSCVLASDHFELGIVNPTVEPSR